MKTTNKQILVITTFFFGFFAKAFASQYALSAFADLQGRIFAPGDVIELPATTDNHLYLSHNQSVATATSNIVTVTGFGAVSIGVHIITNANMSVDYSTTSNTYFYVPPTAIGNGEVYIWKTPNVVGVWSQGSNWVCTSNPAKDGSFYPNGTDDTALFFLTTTSGTQQTLTEDITLGRLYLGTIAHNPTVGNELVLRPASDFSTKLTFKRSDNEPSQVFCMGTGFTTSGGWPNTTIRLGGWTAGNDRLEIISESDLIFDLGNNGRQMWQRSSIENMVVTYNIPEGRTFTVQNAADNDRGKFSVRDINSSLEKMKVIGKGTFIKETPTYEVGQTLNTFEGILISSYETQYTNVNHRGVSLKKAFTNNVMRLALYGAVNQENKFSASYGGGLAQSGFDTSDADGFGHLPKQIEIHGGYLLIENEKTNTTANPAIAEINYNISTLTVSKTTGRFDVKISNGKAYNRVVVTNIVQQKNGSLFMWIPGSDQNLGTNGVLKILNIDQFWKGNPSSIEQADCPIVPWMTYRADNVSSGGTKVEPFVGFDPVSKATLTNCYFYITYPATLASTLTATTTNRNFIIERISYVLSENRTVNSLGISNGGDINDVSTKYTLGADKTLTITSGGLTLAGNSHLGVTNRTDNGNLVFGDKAYVWTIASGTSDTTNTLAVKMSSTNGFVKCGLGTLVLVGDQTGLQNGIYATCGRLLLGSPLMTNSITTATDLFLQGKSDVTILYNGTLFTKANVAFDDTNTKLIGRLTLGSDVVQGVSKLYINGENMPRGTYGSDLSDADYIDGVHFAGQGVLLVNRDESSPPNVITIR